MESRAINIENIESFVKGIMNSADRIEFDKAIQENAELAGEVAAYRRIFQGLDGLAAETFKQKMDSWSAEWAEADGEEIMLIEAYLKDNLSANLKKETTDRIKIDLEFANKVKQYKTIYSGFLGIQNQDFISKMKTWEKERTSVSKPEMKIRPIYRRLAMVASFLLILSVGIKWYASTNYSPEAMLKTFYQKLETGGTMGSEVPAARKAIEAEFASAHDLMENRDYENAAEAFDNVLISLDAAGLPTDKMNFLNDNSNWSKALALLGEENENEEEVKVILQEIIQTSSDDYYKSEAKYLLKKMNSFWYKIN